MGRCRERDNAYSSRQPLLPPHAPGARVGRGAPAWGTGNEDTDDEVRMNRAALATVGLALLAAASLAADAGDYLAKDGKLRHPLEFRDGQSGFAGLTGTAWRVEPDGSWAVATFRNDKVQRMLRKGKLSEKQLAALAGHLAGLDVAGLPEALGGFKGANPHVFSLRFGGLTATATVAAGQALTETAMPGEAAWPRFVAAAAVIQCWTAGGEAEK